MILELLNFLELQGFQKMLVFLCRTMKSLMMLFDETHHHSLRLRLFAAVMEPDSLLRLPRELQFQIPLIHLPELSLRILDFIKSRGRITNSEIVTLTNANRNTVKKHLEALSAAQHIQKNGVAKGTWYSLKKH